MWREGKALIASMIMGLLLCSCLAKDNHTQKTDSNDAPLTTFQQPQQLVETVIVQDQPQNQAEPKITPPHSQQITKTIPTTYEQTMGTRDISSILEELKTSIEKLAIKSPQNEDAIIQLAIFYILSDNFPAAEQILSQLTGERETELVTLLKSHVYNMLGLHDKAERNLDSVIQKWRSQKGVQITSISLCKAVYKPGEYDPNRSGELAPGEPALVHITVRDFLMQKVDNSLELFLRYNWELYNDKGQIIPIRKWQEASEQDKMDKKRYSDKILEFHQFFRLPLPKNLPMGRYKIRVYVEDGFSGKQTYADVEFYVTADWGS